MPTADVISRLQHTPADPSKAGTGSVWDHLSVTARGLIPRALALGATDDLVYNTLVNSDYGVGSHDGGMTAMFNLIRALQGGPTEDPPAEDPNPNPLPMTTDPATVLDYALQGFDWSGTPVQYPPTTFEKAALVDKLRADPAYAGIDINLLIVLVYTVRLKASYAFGENVPNPADYVGISFEDWCKNLQRGLPSL